MLSTVGSTGVGKIADSDLMARLAQHRALGNAPASEHAWLVAHGSLRKYDVGDVVTAKGESAAALHIFFTGHLVIRMDRGAGSHKIFEWHGGDVGGVMPYSRGASPPNDAIAEAPIEALAVSREVFPDLIRECPVVTATLVHIMIDRARRFTSSDLRDEKLISLGKLASGLAHELNNPASAVVRGAKMLSESLGAAEDAARRLGAAHLSESQFASIDSVRERATQQPPTSLSAVARADREDEIADWLAAHGANESCAGPLADSSVTLADLDSLAANVRGGTLDAALMWLAEGSLMRGLSADIQRAGLRIYDLVAAVKGFSYMDRAPTPEPVDIRQGISDTLTMLGAKMRSKSVEVSVNVPDELLRAHAVGAELNQIWMNLIDNALDAVETGGRVDVTATTERNCVTVRVIDNGPGIPPEIQGRIFDPFFTTKGVGKGSGLGLDIVRRLLQRHEGEVSVESAPGRTEFQVRLPAAK